jgi:hypothetical protein
MKIRRSVVHSFNWHPTLSVRSDGNEADVRGSTSQPSPQFVPRVTAPDVLSESRRRRTNQIFNKIQQILDEWKIPNRALADICPSNQKARLTSVGRECKKCLCWSTIRLYRQGEVFGCSTIPPIVIPQSKRRGHTEENSRHDCVD